VATESINPEGCLKGLPVPEVERVW
jgi:hypothetical protein